MKKYLLLLVAVINFFFAQGCGGDGIPQAIETCSSNDDCQIGVCVKRLCVSKNTIVIPPKTECQKGETKPCYPSRPETQNVGLCKAGKISCQENGTWEKVCAGAIIPEKETCNGKDDDCNGIIDDEPVCVKPTDCKPGTEEPCYTGDPKTKNIGTCKEGKRFCSDKGVWGKCMDEVLPLFEKCDDKLDNDCDGTIDNPSQCEKKECVAGQTRPCYTGAKDTLGKGICAGGIEHCIDSKWSGSCVGETTPQREICDKLDNNCDGQIDELPECQQECVNTTTRPCYTGPIQTKGIGSCKDGTQTCVQGKWEVCKNQILPVPESCDGKDNDCDGFIDNKPSSQDKLTQSCYTGDPKTKNIGECSGGVQICANGQWSTCTGEVLPQKELCDQKDNDCDGQVDNQFQNQLGSACLVGKGECKADGIFVCSPDKSGTVCNAQAKAPQTETCNGKDDDCDGKIDNGSDVDCSNACGTGKKICSNGVLEVCNAPQPQTETCNGKDDDCDGKIDNDLKRFCSTLCGTGTETCSQGAWINCTVPKPQTETCNGKDDDCDGMIDNGIGSTCPESVKITLITPFTAGSPATEPERDPSNENQCVISFFSPKIIVTRNKITVEQFNALMGYVPTQTVTNCPTCPVTNITWYEAAAYANKLSTQFGLKNCYGCSGSGSSIICNITGNYYSCSGWKIPPEMVWESFTRCGTTGATYGPVNDISWNSSNSTGIQPVGQKTRNACGLAPLGNVFSMTADSYMATPPTCKAPPATNNDPLHDDLANTEYTARGSSCLNASKDARAARRTPRTKNTSDPYTGFELVRNQ